MTGVSCRQAAIADAADILALLRELAAEIPLLGDSLEREEALYALIRNGARSGESWVAANDAGRIVGVVLAERAQHGRHYAEHETLDLRYAAAAAHQGADVLDQLIEKVLAGMVPVTATVSPHNRSGLAARLQRLGFHPTAGSESDGSYRWQPGH